jgi:hypothetical protein
MIAKK